MASPKGLFLQSLARGFRTSPRQAVSRVHGLLQFAGVEQGALSASAALCRFYKGQDYDGGDLIHYDALEDDLPTLARLCAQTPACKAFNSQGWLKDRSAHHADSRAFPCSPGDSLFSCLSPRVPACNSGGK